MIVKDDPMPAINAALADSMRATAARIEEQRKKGVIVFSAYGWRVDPKAILDDISGMIELALDGRSTGCFVVRRVEANQDVCQCCGHIVKPPEEGK